MTSPNSSISSSNAGRYLALFAAAALALLALAAGLTHYGIETGRVKFSAFDLYAYQRDKLAAAGDVDTLFLGDSSLGNAIDAAHWQELTGERTLNLALTGAYGYAGSYNLLRDALAQGLKPKRVILMNTVEMMEREVAWRGYLVTLHGELPADDLPLLEYLKLHLDGDTAWGVVRFAISGGKGRGQTIENDYVRQGETQLSAEDREAAARRLAIAAINPEKALFLERIAALCEAHQIDCRYAHGPVVAESCAAGRSFLDAADAAIAAAGLTLVADSPICMPPDAVGDSPDHVRPDLRATYTEAFHGLLTAASD